MRCTILAGLLLVSSPLLAQTVEGVVDKEVYTDKVTFRVPTEAGYSYRVQLDGVDQPAGVSVLVDRVDYHELIVKQWLPPATEPATPNLTVQFIIKSSEREDSEWGLPPWVPYPNIPASSEEFAGAHLRVVAPAAFPQGIEIPAFAWVEDEADKRVGVNGFLHAPEFPAHDLELFRGVGSALLPAATAGGALSWTPGVYTLSAPKTIAIDASTSWTAASGTISASTTWAENSRIAVTGNLTVAAGATLTVGAGAVVRVAPDAEIEVSGTILVNGTVDRPVVFTPANRADPWGGFLFRASTSVADMKYAIMTGACADPDWFGNNPDSGGTHLPNQALIYLSNGAKVTLTDCYLFDSAGQAGHGESSTLTMNRSVFQRFLTGGEYNAGTVRLNGCAVIEFPSAHAPFEDDDGDAIYFTGGAHYVTDTLIGWAHDDGTDSGSGAGGTVTVTRSWYESDYHEGMAWSSDSGSRTVTATDTVAFNCGQGFESGWGTPNCTANHCLFTANCTGARLGDNYDWDYNGYLHINNSIVLHNYRDIWGRAWDNWEVHLSQMAVAGTHITAVDPLFPANPAWDPSADAALLEPFLPTPAGAAVGIGIALRGDDFDLASATAGVPVRLSTFTTRTVSVGYRIVAQDGVLGTGTLEFLPGETVKRIPITTEMVGTRKLLQVEIADPVNAQVTGIPEVMFVEKVEVTILPAGSTWKYLDGGVDPGTAWKKLSFNDTAWKSGAAALGHSDGPVTDIDIGPDGGRYPTIYFRARFDVVDPATLDGLRIRLRRDDGAIVWLNETEVFRTNMPSGTIGYSDWASGSASDDGDNFQVKDTDAAALVAGTNILAVEVHQSDEDSSDMTFDLALIGTQIPAIDGEPRFIRGDANGDGSIDISDALNILFFLYAGAGTDCRDALDSNDDGVLGLPDAVTVLQYLFQSGAVFAPPFPGRGEDPTSDSLDCTRR
jgi:hypothetical protein